jgi:DNA polymerase III delta prime subunit
MLCETQRPELFDEIIGHEEPKRILTNYLKNKPYHSCVFLTGTAGIGKTTLALASTRMFGFEPLEINASKSIRTFTDVERLKDSCRSSFSIQSLLRNNKQPLCVILDEVDGSDPHAQRRIIEWIRDNTRTVPIICTGNDVPVIFKRNAEFVNIVRCFPPKASEVQTLFPQIDIQILVKECQHDIRRIIHRVQYGQSYVIPKYNVPPTGLSVEETFIRRQAMFGLADPLAHRNDKQDSERSS